MDEAKYRVTQYQISSLLGLIDENEIAVPEIQRPFVWDGAEVRDFIDSLYKGYPTGYLITWKNPNVRLKDGRNAEGKTILIDGQQRVTSLMTALRNRPILTENYDEKVIRIAFNPMAAPGEEAFAVQTPVHVKSNAWIEDISVLMKPEFRMVSFHADYMKKNPDADPVRLEEALGRLVGIKSRALGIIELQNVSISEVTEIFVRINSKGTALNEADFAMSKIAADEAHGGNLLRKAIDYFCHAANDASFYAKLSQKDKAFSASKYAEQMAWLKQPLPNIYVPDFSDMLRVSFMHVFRRGKLRDLVSLLSGRNFADRTYSEAIVEDSFQKLDTGVMDFINKHNFEQFLLAIRVAGFTHSKLLKSKMSLDFAYTLFLLLQADGAISAVERKSYLQKWFVLSTLTGRYTGSPESRMDRDIREIAEKGFVRFFQEQEASNLSKTFWETTLPQAFETSSVSSPYLKTFLAAQIYFDSRSLFSANIKIAELVTVAGDIHHIFPRKYLQNHGVDQKTAYNQIANYTYLDRPINITISDTSPQEYFEAALDACRKGESPQGAVQTEAGFWQNLAENAIPKDVLHMTVEDYPEFLRQRRILMAQMVKKYYMAL